MEQNENKIIIVDEQGRERVCEILFTYQHPETEKNYVVLYPIDELDSDEEEMDLFAYSFIENEDGDGELFTLETDEEYDMINEVIDQFYEDQLEGADEE
ncbi:MAG: DUF1292 domain-containing protein [Erysipelotrichaceae bacterium]|nr:DUF1292 domain-containing protein [Erysipelotrichaceae bacterium]